MKHIKIDPLDLFHFPRKPEQEVTEWVQDILAAKGIGCGTVVGHHMDSWGNIVVEVEDD